MKKYYYSDLAVEGFGTKRSTTDLLRSASEHIEYEDNGVKISRIRINAGHERGGGTYITASFGRNHWDEEGVSDCIARLIKERLKAALDNSFGKSARILAVGLGNMDMTADSLGPRTIKKVSVTGNFSCETTGAYDLSEKCKIFAFSPGVMADTGMESAKMIRGVVSECKADAIIVVDSLAAKDVGRLISTVQISDNGISPGSGIYNPRREISESTVGVPVIALGVPTVVDSTTLVCDFLENVGIEDSRGDLRELLERQKGLFVAPKDCDIAVKNLSSLLALSIDKALSF